MGLTIRCAAAALLCAASWSLPAAAAAPTVHIDTGDVAGIDAPDAPVAAYLGIPFAAPPVGPLRWKAPGPAAPWTGTYKADHFMPSCVQPELHGTGPWTQEFYVKPPIAEDCLYLNIWVPRQSDRKLPVVLFLPGGGFIQGGADEGLYYGGKIAERGVIFVSMNYRLGVLGFFAHPALSAESATGNSGNYAFMDQIAALQWIHRNIAAFGGDPNAITVDGQSAGASSIEILLMSPLAKGLFARAIIQSGVSLTGPPVMSKAAIENAGERFAAAKGATTLEQLRAIPAQALIQTADSPIKFGPSVDGDVLPMTPAQLIANGRIADLPVLTGFNAAEGSVPLDVPTRRSDFEQQIRQVFGEQAALVLAAYPPASDTDATQAAQRSGHDRLMVNAYAWAAARGRTATAPLFFYEYDHVMPGRTAPTWGAFHSSEIAYAFQTLGALDRPFGNADYAVSKQISGYWINFIRTGDPNGPGLPNWAAFRAGDRSVMEIGDRPGPHPIAGEPGASVLLGIFQQTVGGN